MPEVPTTENRYYLENDIDFDGVEYDIGGVARGSSSNTVDQGGNIYHFGSEINGNFHTVKNITAWAKDATLNPDGHQSIFGRTIGATVKNIGFENVVFTSSHSYGLCAIMMHHTSIGQMPYNTFTNIRAEFIYAYEATGGVKGEMATGGNFQSLRRGDERRIRVDAFRKRNELERQLQPRIRIFLCGMGMVRRQPYQRVDFCARRS